MEKANRKVLKKTAKGVLKKHYWLLIFVCFAAAMLGTEFTDALEAFKTQNTSPVTVSITEENDDATDAADATGAAINTIGLDGAYNAIAEDQIKSYEEKVQAEKKTKTFQLGGLQIGRTRGVLASVANRIDGGTLFLMAYTALHGVTGSKDVSLLLFVFLAFIIYTMFWIFFTGAYEVIMGRIFLESRVYEKVPKARFLYLIRVKRWIAVSLAIFRKTICELLWGLTIVGGVIKKYSYFCVPYILAENPTLSGKEAILLSRKMMDGHKFEAFKLEYSFILWDFLDAFTLHLLGLFYLNAYKAATYAEYFAWLRNNWVQEGKENYEVLNDVYLYEKPEHELLQETYADIDELRKMPDERYTEGHKFARFMAKNFGIILRHDEEEQKYLRAKSIKQKIQIYTQMVDGETYPSRLSPIPEKEKIANLEGIGYLRCYSVTSLILIFFSVCFVGWLWEVSLHIITDHKFVNRGVLHGPWLPIYGVGGLIILLLLNRFRKKISMEFFMGMLLAGLVEYTSAWQLDTFYHTKWWDYKGYFLNFQGRVCAEGLLIFGLGGLAVVYLVAPMLDNQFRKIPRKITLIVCAVLLITYAGDTIYSSKHPNKGDGITNYKSQIEQYDGSRLCSQNIYNLGTNPSKCSSLKEICISCEE